MSVETIVDPVERVSDLEYYFDLHPTEEDLMGDNKLQTNCMDHLSLVLKWMYHEAGWYIARNLNLHVSPDQFEKPVAPDVALFKGLVEAQLPENLPSWIVGRWNPLTPDEPVAPCVVFEIASEDTWKKDLDDKPGKYARMGAREYFFFIPPAASIPQRIKRIPLRGWRFENGIVIPLNVNQHGWMWSEELESWVVPDGNIVRLYDSGRRRRLTAEEDARAIAEREQMRAEREQAIAERERIRAEREQAIAERERELRQRAWEKLRELGIDPESL